MLTSLMRISPCPSVWLDLNSLGELPVFDGQPPLVPLVDWADDLALDDNICGASVNLCDHVGSRECVGKILGKS